MATVHPLPVPEPASHETLLTRLARLVQLELELGLAETRDLLRAVAISVGVAVVALIALIASTVVLVAGGFAPLFGAAWPHLVIAGGGIFLLALAALGASAWYLAHLRWPKQTVQSFEETWRWLAAQLRSRLTLR